jgi:(R,R)-butanediol dehydrogenase/meso-butanediol dehydrogenase/diacetyl reductase
MTGSMRAAMYYGAHDVRIEERAVPTRSDGEALLRVLRSGMCGTDATEWRDGPHLFPSDIPHPITGVRRPFIPGHEFIGEVVEVGGDSGFRVGDRVASGAGIWCGDCDRCREGRTNLCLRYHTYGLNQDGGMAEFAAVDERTLALIPPALSSDLAGLAQPLAVGLHASRRSGAEDGDRVLIIGAGAIGTFILAALVSRVRAQVFVTDFPGPRLERALRLGAAGTIAAGQDVQERVGELLPGGADVVIEASGAPGQLAAAIQAVRAGGTILQVGLPGRPVELDLRPLVVREVTIKTTNAHVFAEDLAPALDLLASSRIGEELLDSVRPLEDLPAQLELLATGRLEGKVLFDPALPAA